MMWIYIYERYWNKKNGFEKKWLCYTMSSLNNKLSAGPDILTYFSTGIDLDQNFQRIPSKAWNCPIKVICSLWSISHIALINHISEGSVRNFSYSFCCRKKNLSKLWKDHNLKKTLHYTHKMQYHIKTVKQWSTGNLSLSNRKIRDR